MLTRGVLLAGLFGTTALFSAPQHSVAQTIGFQCTGSGTISCSYDGTASAEAVFSSDNIQLNATSTGNVSMDVATGASVGLDIGNSGSGGGASAGGLSFTNNGTVYLGQQSDASIGSGVFGIQAVQQGAAGSQGQNGGGAVGGSTVITNAGGVTIYLPSGPAQGGGAIISGSAFGGSGQEGTSSGWPGGSTNGVMITNTASLSADLNIESGFSGIAAISTGGSGSDAYSHASGAPGGGAAGPVVVSSSGSINLSTDWFNPTANDGIYGILAQTSGGGGGNNWGDNSSSNASGGGDGGAAAATSVTLTKGANISISADHPSPDSNAIVTSAGIAAATIGGNGGFGMNNNSSGGGNGGGAGATTISITDASVTTSAQTDSIVGVLAYGLGGNGGAGGNPGAGGPTGDQDQDPSENGGDGGGTGAATITVSAQTQGITISTATASGDNAPAVTALLLGGDGGTGGYSKDAGASTSHGGNGGNGGSAGSITLGFTGSSASPISLATNGQGSPGISAVSSGGQGADGGGANTALFGTAIGGQGGDGGTGGDVTISLASTSVTTQQDNSPGIVAKSEAGVGGTGGSAGGFANAKAGSGGNGGDVGSITITLDSASAVTTSGVGSMGIIAQNLSGAGGDGNAGQGYLGSGGSGGSGGSSGSLNVQSNGTISTDGQGAHGIIAQSLAGAGGSGSSGWGLFGSSGGTGESAGTVGHQVDVTNGGAITTNGGNAYGVLLQSIGGGGGAGGGAGGPIANLGGNGGLASNGDVIDYEGYGSVTTTGTSAIGVLGQSIGGGGGDGGGASGLDVTVGGTGGGGGNGGWVFADLYSGSQIFTSGDGASGLVMQSIGGGGGNAGNAASGGLFASLGIGGVGGDGRAGSQVQISSGGTISTQGSNASGIVAQSIGGGGGSGGAAFAGSISVGFSFGAGIGGTGGSGGNGGPVSVNVVGGTVATGTDPLLVNGTGGGATSNTLPVDSFGVLVQSIGGGGGVGGSALAEAVAIGIPIPDESVAVAGSFTLAGAAGNGAAGGNALFGLSDGGSITTRGAGSMGVLVQSVGGGGGAGGSSQSMAAAIGYGSNALPKDAPSWGFTPTFSQGGKGGAGAVGGTVMVALGGTVSTPGSTPTATRDDSGAAPTSIVTYGDFANGMMAQSIGGGGGNAGIGSGNTQGFGTATSTSLQVTLGSQGGTGGDGGPVTANLYSGSILTLGSGSIGLLAQSIGGGGGASQGGSFNIAQSFQLSDAQTYKPGVNFSLGGTGVQGGVGLDVTVNVGASITTFGGDAIGVLAQSIGGGGGVGGSAGADASADNPVISAEMNAFKGREAGSDLSSLLDGLNTSGNKLQLDYTQAISIGGKGGSGGNGGPVSVTVSAPVATSGDWAHGVVAQSVGGGGGKGGTSAASGTSDYAEEAVNIEHAIGGNGGSGGEGGPVKLTLNQGTVVATGASNGDIAGFGGWGAIAVVGQSIGGGGGIGGDGSDLATGIITVGGANSGSSGGSGGGGVVGLETKGSSQIITSGDAADGVVLQSIGGGGGIGGAGSSYWASNPDSNMYSPGGTFNPTLSLTVGGGTSSNGDGNIVIFDSSASPVSISTSGYNSFGILAQSIGGGGGLVSSTRSVANPATDIGGLGSGNGGLVDVTLGQGSSITTTGIGAFGIAAQSIGGGGGVLRVVGWGTDVPVLVTGTDTNTPQSHPAYGGGGPVNVTVAQNSSITVSGAGSIGVFAQNVSGGGGLIANGTGMYAGAPLQGQESCAGKICALTPSVNVTVAGSVSATGQNGIGVFAQSAGVGVSKGVTVNVSGNVIGGTTTNYGNQPPASLGTETDVAKRSGGAAIQIDTMAGSPGGKLVIGSAGLVTTVSGTDGAAVVASGGGYSDIVSDGRVTGSLFHNGGLFTNRGSYYSGAEVQGRVITSGIFNLGMPGELRNTHVTGDFTQTDEGRLGVTVDSLNKAAGHLQVDGTAALDGKIVPTVLTLLPGALPVVTAGHLTSTADGLDALLFHWDTAQSGNTLTLAPRSDFKPGGVALNDSQSSLAGYYGRAWANGDKAFATRFAELSTINDRSDYKAALDAWSSKAAHAQSIALANSAGTILGAAMSCPVFIDDSVMLGEDNCAWAKVTGRWTDQSSTGDTQGYYVSGTTYRIGAQHEIAPDWYLGASFGFGQSWARMDGGSSGNGDTYDGSVTVKRVMGPWQFAGSVAFAGGSFEADRRVDIPGIASETLKSDPSILLAGGRLRAAYEFAFQDWYIRPYGDLDVVYTDLPGFKEKGDDLYALDVHGSSKTGVALSPMVEFGGRLDLDAESTLRAYAAFGMSYLPDNTRTIRSSFVGASSENGIFSDHIDSPELLGRIDVGVQLFRAGGFELKGEYTADIGGSFLSQSASARFAYHF